MVPINIANTWHLIYQVAYWWAAAPTASSRPSEVKWLKKNRHRIIKTSQIGCVAMYLVEDFWIPGSRALRTVGGMHHTSRTHFRHAQDKENVCLGVVLVWHRGPIRWHTICFEENYTWLGNRSAWTLRVTGEGDDTVQRQRARLILSHVLANGIAEMQGIVR